LGTFVTTPAVSATSATIHVRSSVINQSAKPSVVSLAVSLIAPNGKHLQTFLSPTPITIAPGASFDLNAETKIPNPYRWDLVHPTLYTVHTALMREGRAVDNEDLAIGIREFHFDPNQGFFLNGTHHKIYGVALHTDAGAVGTAVPLALCARRLTELR